MSTPPLPTADEPPSPAMLPWATRLRRWLADDAQRHRRASWLFLRGLGVTWLIAFGSLSVQIHGLVGESGILPAQEYLEAASAHLGEDAWRQLPTLAWWFGASDGALTGMCVAGLALSVLLIADVAPLFMLIGLWALYLSLSGVCQIFLGYQWDALLLEVGLLAVAMAPWRIAPQWRDPEAPPWIGLWLQRWLLFRLMFSSGVVKLASGDPTWADWTAMTYHYWTQPLPNPLSWAAHHQPLLLHKASVVAMFVAELFLPLLIFTHRHARLVAAIGFTLLMGLINLTGNYGFFGVLSVCLCVLLVEDRWFYTANRPTKPPQEVVPQPLWRARGQLAVAGLLALLTLPVTLIHVGGLVVDRRALPTLAMDMRRAVAPLRSVNRYGLFAVMTTHRDEITLEGSMDGVQWEAYTLPYKPGPSDRAPGLAGVHMPRLDWQLWFAALGDVRRNRWVMQLMVRLMEGSPDVLGLVERDPFEGEPPRYMRATIRSATWSSNEGVWWELGEPRLYSPVISQDDLE